MLRFRRSTERGHADHGWLRSHHTFSFAGYYDPSYMGVSALRVINDDTVAPGAGFDTHSHRDMEIVSYVLDGALEHKDSMGNGAVIRPGDVQRMSAGTGVTHSEFNHSDTEPVHFLQIWILPSERGLAPSYEQIHVSDDEKQGRLRLIASGRAVDGAVLLHQDVDLYAARLSRGETVEHVLAPGRQAWVHVARGSATLDGEPLVAGDAAHVVQHGSIRLNSPSSTEVLLFDLP